MPTYTYRCNHCGHQYDAFQNMKDEPHSVCPQCGSAIDRLIGGGSGIVFKGSGFYVTDYRKDGAKSPGEKSAPAAAAPAASPAAPASAPAAPTGGGSST